jgi:phage terminase large subunit-like protein
LERAHHLGRVSDVRPTLDFKSYDQGRTKWQGKTLDFVWFDEEPRQDIYFQGLTRTNATDGMAYLTFHAGRSSLAQGPVNDIYIKVVAPQSEYGLIVCSQHQAD